MNDALLSGSIDLGSAGVGPLLTICDPTGGNANAPSNTTPLAPFDGRPHRPCGSETCPTV